ncbi:hypothetical protein AAHE18_19G063000 [Arachis hypogaea]|uniref:Uncharacterized protein n=1 Tax=Arachis hypogaea TaxID=3818 RepID=A0A6B9V5Z9_ARAHY|nr:uncharacterized protein DS421_19g643420 [Arachis hypogaea]
MLMSSHMMTNSKAYLSFLIFASLLSSHVLTHELSEGSYSGYHSKDFQWTMLSELPKAKKDQYTTYSLGYFLSQKRPKRRRINPPPPPRRSPLQHPHSPSHAGRPLDPTPMPPLPTPPPISDLNH